MNYVAKFSTGGRNANIWNGPSTITTDENFIVFNFQSLLSNRNSTVANAQMLLVLKYVDNEIIKNRDYNLKFHANRKIVVAIDEAHVFIDTKFPVALDFMFQLAKRIRKYNGMQIVITQNIKDFVGSEEIARKSTAIINACQYSFIFALAPNDMQDLCTLYEKAGGINESEQEQITGAARGQAFTILGASSRTSFRVEVPEDVVDMFQNPDYVSRYFVGEEGAGYWEDFIGGSREEAEANRKLKPVAVEKKAEADTVERKHVTFLELTEEEAEAEATPVPESESEPEPEPQPAPAPEPQPAPAPQAMSTAPAQPGSSSGGTEQLLTQLLEKFSYDVLSAQIRQAVEQQVALKVAEELAARGIDAAQSLHKPEEPEVSGTESEESYAYDLIRDDADDTETDAGSPEEDATDSEDSYMDLFSDDDDDVFGTDSTEDDTDSYEEAEDEDEEEEEEDDDDDDELDFFNSSDDSDKSSDSEFDLMGMLTQLADEMDDITPIDVMDAYGEEVVDISLEDLAKYVKKNIYHQ